MDKMGAYRLPPLTSKVNFMNYGRVVDRQGITPEIEREVSDGVSLSPRARFLRRFPHIKPRPFPFRPMRYGGFMPQPIPKPMPIFRYGGFEPQPMPMPMPKPMPIVRYGGFEPGPINPIIVRYGGFISNGSR